MGDEASNPKVVLPEAGKRNILITSALPYVNNVPHLGNLIGSVLSADVFARYCRGRGLNTLYICGTDEYGTTAETKALIEKCTPQELCDKYHVIHADVYKWFNISFDIFGRTTTQLQTDITQDIFLRLNQNGFLKEQITTQLYCPQHESFLADRFVEGECPICGYADARGDQCDFCGQLLDTPDLKNPRCKIDGATPTTRDTKHIFLDLDKLQPEIEAYFRQSVSKGVWSSNGVEITASWLKQGLIARSITRDIRWGTKVPLPGYEDKVIYSWFDACIGYVSITAQYTDQWQKWWHNPDDVQLYQFIGKDNVPYHSVIFPGSQIGTRDTWTKLHHLSTTEYLTYEGGKFSKPGDEFNWDSFINANSALLNNLGNFVSRVVRFVNSKIYASVVPNYVEYQDDSFDAWKAEIDQLLTRYIQELDAVKLRAGLSTVMAISQKGNGFLQSNGFDNKLAVNEPSKCAAVIGLAINLVHLLASLMAPYMPESAKSITTQLRVDPLPIPDNWQADSIKPGHKIGQATYLFSRIKPEKGQEWRELYGSEEAKKVKEEEAKRKMQIKAAKRARKEQKEASA